jgi:hypothetical protein
MMRSEEYDLRDGFFYDAAVKGSDTNFWKGDTANLLADTVRGAVKVGDTGLVGHASSYAQFLYGDFEFGMLLDSTVPDSNDSGRYFGLRNIGDTLNRGAAYFDLTYDTTLGDSSDTTRPFAVVMFDEAGNRQRKFIQWDTHWSGTGTPVRFRIRWEMDGYTFLINDTVIAVLGDRDTSQQATFQINTTIPQALRISKDGADTSDTNPMAFKFVNVRNARKVI